MTRRSLVGALVGLAFAAAAGVGLAQVTTGSTESRPPRARPSPRRPRPDHDDRRPRRTVRGRPGVGVRVRGERFRGQGIDIDDLEHDVDDPVDADQTTSTGDEADGATSATARRRWTSATRPVTAVSTRSTSPLPQFRRTWRTATAMGACATTRRRDTTSTTTTVRRPVVTARRSRRS